MDVRFSNLGTGCDGFEQQGQSLTLVLAESNERNQNVIPGATESAARAAAIVVRRRGHSRNIHWIRQYANFAFGNRVFRTKLTSQALRRHNYNFGAAQNKWLDARMQPIRRAIEQTAQTAAARFTSMFTQVHAMTEMRVADVAEKQISLDALYPIEGFATAQPIPGITNGRRDVKRYERKSERPPKCRNANPPNSIRPWIIEFDGKHGKFVHVAQRREKSALAFANRVPVRDVRVENRNPQFPLLLKPNSLRPPAVSPRCRCSCTAEATKSNSTLPAPSDKLERAAAAPAAPASAIALRE